MRNCRALIAYNGSQYFGWQRQAGFESVQEEFEGALESIVGDHVTVHGSGRTDTGVHAVGQVASFHLETRLSDHRLQNAINAHLPNDIAVNALETCADDFHARFSARGKRYGYLCFTGRTRPVFGLGSMHWERRPLDLEAMRTAASELLGQHDFQSFAASGSPRKDTIRMLQHLHIHRRRDRIAFVCQGDGFLYNMVRNLVGTLFEVGLGRRDPNSMGELLGACDRKLAGATAPAAGLYLLRVLYPDQPFA